MRISVIISLLLHLVIAAVLAFVRTTTLFRSNGKRIDDEPRMVDLTLYDKQYSVPPVKAAQVAPSPPPNETTRPGNLPRKPHHLKELSRRRVSNSRENTGDHRQVSQQSDKQANDESVSAGLAGSSTLTSDKAVALPSNGTVVRPTQVWSISGLPDSAQNGNTLAQIRLTVKDGKTIASEIEVVAGSYVDLNILLLCTEAQKLIASGPSGCFSVEVKARSLATINPSDCQEIKCTCTYKDAGEAASFCATEH